MSHFAEFAIVEIIRTAHEITTTSKNNFILCSFWMCFPFSLESCQDYNLDSVWVDRFSMCLFPTLAVTVIIPRGHFGFTLAYSAVEQKANMSSQPHKREGEIIKKT